MKTDSHLQIILLHVKSLVNKPPSRFPSGAPIKRDAHLQSLSLHILLDPQEGSPPPGSPNRAPANRDAPFLEPSFNYLSKFPGNGTPPPGSPTDRHTHFHSLILHIPW